MFDGLDFRDDLLHHGFDTVFEGRPAVGAVATGTCQFHDDGVVVGEFHEVDVAAVLLEVGTHLFEDVFDFSEDGFFIHIYLFSHAESAEIAEPAGRLVFVALRFT